MMKEKLETYRLYEAGTMLGMSKNEIEDCVKANFESFPFQVIQLGRNYVVSKKQIDNFLERGIKPIRTERLGRKRKWIDGQFVYWRFPVPLELDAQFNAIIENINKELPSKMDKADFQRLSIIEFISRRPEFQHTEK